MVIGRPQLSKPLSHFFMRRIIDSTGRMGGYDNTAEFQCPKGLSLDGDSGTCQAHWNRGKNGKITIHRVNDVSLNDEEKGEDRYADGNPGAEESGEDRMNLGAIDKMGHAGPSKG